MKDETILKFIRSTQSEIDAITFKLTDIIRDFKLELKLRDDKIKKLTEIVDELDNYRILHQEKIHS